MPTFRVFIERECTVGMYVTVEADTGESAEEAVQDVVDQCAEETGGRTFPPIQYGVDLRPAWAVAVQARLGEEWRIVEDFEVTVLHVKEVSAPETGLHLEKEDGARSMLYTLCIHCQTNHVIPEPDTPEVEPSCPDCGKALGVLGLALKGDDEEDAAD